MINQVISNISIDATIVLINKYFQPIKELKPSFLLSNFLFQKRQSKHTRKTISNGINLYPGSNLNLYNKGITTNNKISSTHLNVFEFIEFSNRNQINYIFKINYLNQLQMNQRITCNQ